jgi:outer membrane protein OmpA-like peptidoglycan-associated protein
LLLLLLLAVVGTTGCPPQPRPATPPPGVDPPLAQAVGLLLYDLNRQLGPAPDGSRMTVFDPLLDGKTGQQTGASVVVQKQIVGALGPAVRSVALVQFNAAGANAARNLMNGTLTALPEPNHYRLNVALSDRTSGLVVAQSVVRFQEPNLDTSPTKFYGDSPSLVRDRSVEGYVRTAETPAGKQADPLYIDQLPTAALLAEALDAYNTERWADALSYYTQASKRPDGQQLRTFNGMYLTETQLGHTKEAEEAFGKIAALGLATNNLAVKLLFRPGSTDFWEGSPTISAYPMWLRQIAHTAQTAGSCLDVIGHTSRSGPEAVNDRLSLLRATAIRDQLDKDAHGLSRKSRVTGLGYRENIIGTGTDDSRDAVDRRVEFKVIDCADVGKAHPMPAVLASPAEPIPAAAPPLPAAYGPGTGPPSPAAAAAPRSAATSPQAAGAYVPPTPAPAPSRPPASAPTPAAAYVPPTPAAAYVPPTPAPPRGQGGTNGK